MTVDGRFALLCIAIFTLLLASLSLSQSAQAQDDAPTPTPESWLILPDMPETATQADYGAEIYRLVCRDCHGDEGQGLTEQWIQKGFTAEDQNCWQAKCHAGSHPVDGFVLPKYVPPLAGEETLTRFNTSLDLYNFMRTAMPYHNPGSLLDREYWQLTAFVMEMNGLAPLPTSLAEEQAAQLVLHPNRPLVEPTAVPTPTPLPQPQPTATERWSWGFLGLLGVMGLATALLLWRRH
jgi:cytochrome c5